MERNSSLRNQSIYSGTMKDSSSSNNNKVLMRDSWRNTREDLFPWPPRSYSCSFCKREFRSAQALGGHMNVHRRDRARLLRQSPPRNGQFSFLNLNLDPNQNLNPNPNPNPNFSSSTSSILFRQPFTSNLPPLVSPSLANLSNPSSTSRIKECGRTNKDHLMSIYSGDHNLSNKKSTKAFLGVGKFDGFCIDGNTTRKAHICDRRYSSEITSHERDVMKTAEVVRLNLEIGIISDSKSDLDLELRLGQS